MIAEIDECCFPHSSAMNTAEIELFEIRNLRFGEKLADQLVIRDRDQDDRISCGECKQGKSSVCEDVTPKPWDVLQRCDHFQSGPFDADLDLPVITRGLRRPVVVKGVSIPHASDF